ncbi:hypothetical protein [Pseudoalteromonas luteoviolacea]|uniref:hypothetical protein n=1 Tax=Pseudoalteromonas luteoviolacea TaxID=43657 RepID=UPI00114F3D6E|nr:hypothetical protein [Pseudoalteromonas luteoviolacea]TQF69544.1 hypothetical protein FLM44_00050 [Pseudoalteromonas luteoviolacea]
MPTLEQEVAKLQQTNADLVAVGNTFVSEFAGKIGAIDAAVNKAKEQFEDWLNTRHVGFSLVDTLHDRSSSPLLLPPRFSTQAEADQFTFSSANDYAPQSTIDNVDTAHYVDVFATMPGEMNFFSEPTPSQFTGRVSVYASISVGEAPHPNPKSRAQVALLMNNLGTPHPWITTNSATPNFAEPRALLSDPANTNKTLLGQSWLVNAFNDVAALAENVPNTFGIGFSALRIINLGPNPIAIKGLWIVHHGHNKDNTQ